MELREYLRIITKRGWLIVLLIAVTVGSTLVFSRLQTPVYRSSIFLNVWSGRLDWGLQQTIKGLMRNYARNIRSRATAMEVIDHLQLDITPDELGEKLTVSSIESDFLIQIDADDYDPLIARDIAQTTAETFVADIEVFMLEQDKRDRVEVTILDYAQPGGLHKPRWKINALAGAVFGGLMGVLAAFLLEWLEADVIRTSEDIERYTNVAVLGVIPVVGTSSRRSRRRSRTLTAHQKGGQTTWRRHTS